MKKFLQSLGQLTTQTVNAVVSSAQFAIDSNQPTEFTTQNLSINCIPSTDPENPVVHVQVVDTTQPYNDTHLVFNYNHEGEFMTAIAMQSFDKPEPQPKAVGIIIAMLQGSDIKGIDLRKN